MLQFFTCNCYCSVCVVLTAEDIHPEHCVVEYADDQVSLHACDGKCYVNHVEVTEQNKISHGTYM